MDSLYDIKIDEINEFINQNCLINCGKSFDIESIKLSRHSSSIPLCFEWYVKEKTSSILGMKTQECYMPEDIKKIEELLRKLPSGVSFTKKVEFLKFVKQPLSEVKSNKKFDPFKQPDSFRYYTTKFIINVSKKYSNKICSSSKIRISECENINILRLAFEFYESIKNRRSDIIKKLYEPRDPNKSIVFSFQSGWSNYRFENDRCLYDYDYITEKATEFVCYSSFGLKSIEERFQRLGLAIAVANYGKSYLNKNQYYFLSSSDCYTEIKKMTVKEQINPNDYLEQW